ncbi:MAG: toxin-antitoxin system YwqK family antitoxin [Bdellovibrionota bacterium]
MRWLGALFTILLISCTYPGRPCEDGGEAARDQLLKASRQCFQRKDATGKWVNHGPYIDWYPNGKRAMTGFYKLGKKDGRWTTYDEKGRKTSEKEFENGVEVTRFETEAPRLLPGPPPTPKPGVSVLPIHGDDRQSEIKDPDDQKDKD